MLEVNFSLLDLASYRNIVCGYFAHFILNSNFFCANTFFKRHCNGQDKARYKGGYMYGKTDKPFSEKCWNIFLFQKGHTQLLKKYRRTAKS